MSHWQCPYCKERLSSHRLTERRVFLFFPFSLKIYELSERALQCSWSFYKALVVNESEACSLEAGGGGSCSNLQLLSVHLTNEILPLPARLSGWRVSMKCLIPPELLVHQLIPWNWFHLAQQLMETNSLVPVFFKSSHPSPVIFEGCILQGANLSNNSTETSTTSKQA